MLRFIAVCLAICLAAGCSGPPTPASTDKILRVAYSDDVATFDPDNAIILYGLDASRVIYEGLVQYAPGSTAVVGWLAKSWTVSPDGLTYTFVLQQGVAFHSGHLMTSADVLASFKRRQSPNFPLSYFLLNVETMSAPDAQTFVIRLKMPEPAFIDRLASPWGPKVIGPAALVEHAGNDQGATWLNEHDDGTGPFTLAEMSRGERYVLRRFNAYWGKPPYFDQVQALIVPSVNQQMLMLQRGELDIIDHGYPFDQLDRLPPQLKVDAHDALGLEMAYINQTRALRDPALRTAVLTAINPALWLKDAFGRFATLAPSLYPKAMLEGPAPVEFPTDMPAAREIVSHAGKFQFVIGYADQEASVQQRVAELLTAQLRQIGIDATIQVIPVDQESSLGSDPARAPDIFIAQNYPDAVHPATQTVVFFETGAALNFFGYSNKKVDALCAEAGRMTDIAERNKLYLEVSRILFDDGAFVPLADIKDVIVYRADLADLNTRPAFPWAVDYATIRRN